MAEVAFGLALLAVLLSAACLLTVRTVARQLDQLARRTFSIIDGRQSEGGQSGPVHPELARAGDDREIVALVADAGCLGCADRVTGFAATAAGEGVRRVVIVASPDVPSSWTAVCRESGIDILHLEDLTSEWIVVATPVLVGLDASGRELRRRVAASDAMVEEFLSVTSATPPATMAVPRGAKEGAARER